MIRRVSIQDFDKLSKTESQDLLDKLVVYFAFVFDNLANLPPDRADYAGGVLHVTLSKD